MSNELQNTQDIIIILSKLPEFLRESMMKSRLQELCTCSPEARGEIIDSILVGMASADINALTKVIRTWLAVVSGLEIKDILTIFESYINRVGCDPSVVDSNCFNTLFEAFQILDTSRRNILRNCLIETILNHPRGRHIIYRLPEKIRLALVFR
jgi:hypothetical protein